MQNAQEKVLVNRYYPPAVEVVIVYHLATLMSVLFAMAA